MKIHWKKELYFISEELEPIGCFIIKHKDGIVRVQESHITNYKL